MAAADPAFAVTVLDHGVLAQDQPDNVALVKDLGSCDVICLGTSLTDSIPLTLARSAQQLGRSVVVVLDNWVNYRSRLATDGLPPMIPDLYAVMDDKAAQEAVDEGIPHSCLRVTGHPNLAALHTQASQVTATWCQSVLQSLGLGLGGCQLVAFINEPVSADQGTGPDNPLWRGYTEADAMTALAAGLRAHAVEVAIVPHPRDQIDRVRDVWERVRGSCAGQVVSGISGRDVVLAADRVAGMASILLYEAWLLGRPTLSLQPGLVRPDLLSIASRPGIHLMRDTSLAPVAAWLADKGGTLHPDLFRHAGAAQRILDLLR